MASAWAGLAKTSPILPILTLLLLLTIILLILLFTTFPYQLRVAHGSQITPLIDAREKCCQKHTLASGQGVQDWMTRAQSSSWRHSAQQSPI